SLPSEQVLGDIEQLQAKLRARGHLLGPLAGGAPQQVLDAALTAFRSFHGEPAVRRAAADPQRIEPGDRQLLFYYQNRVESLGVEPGVVYASPSSAAAGGRARSRNISHIPGAAPRTGSPVLCSAGRRWTSNGRRTSRPARSRRTMKRCRRA